MKETFGVFNLAKTNENISLISALGPKKGSKDLKRDRIKEIRTLYYLKQSLEVISTMNCLYLI